MVPQRLDLVEHVRRGRVQLVQLGTYGPMFYGLADDAEVERSWAGMPRIGIEENLALAGDLIPRVQEAGAKVVGQLSLGWIYGDHETGKGLFGNWARIWTEDLLGPPPCDEVAVALQRTVGGELRCWPIEGRPYRTYSGCMCNPHWLALLKPMVKKAIELGMDGFNAHHNFEQFCQCAHCRHYLMEHLAREFSDDELQRGLDPAGPPATAEYSAPIAVRAAAPRDLRQRIERLLARLVYRRRKEFFDELFVDYGRALKPDLLLAQWYHKYDLSAWDERCLVPDEDWARGRGLYLVQPGWQQELQQCGPRASGRYGLVSALCVRHERGQAHGSQQVRRPPFAPVHRRGGSQPQRGTGLSLGRGRQ